MKFPGELVRRTLRRIGACTEMDAETGVGILVNLAHLGMTGNFGEAVNGAVLGVVRNFRSSADGWNVHGGASVVYALGRLSRLAQNVATSGEVSEMVEQMVNQITRGAGGAMLKTQELANMIYGLALLLGGKRMVGGVWKFLDAASEWVAGRATEFKPQELSISVYSMSQLCGGDAGEGVCRMLGRVGSEIARRWSSCSAQAISNTVYGMARMNFRSEELLQTLSTGLVPRLDEFTPQHISNVMYALGRLGYRDERLLGRICEYIISSGRLREFRPQNISNTIYACWKLQYLHADLFDLVATHLPTRFPECVPQDISNIVFAYGELGFRHSAFFAAVKLWALAFFSRPVSGGTQRDKSFLLSACRRAGIQLSLQ
jgi:hypothetical protein